MQVTSARGFTLIELLIVVTLIGILSSLSAPFLMSARISGNEASAIGSLRAINSGEAAYASTCGAGNFSTSIATLTAEGYLSPDLNLTPKSGYVITLAVGAGGAAGPPDCAGGPSATTFYSSAVPVSASTGRRAFASNADSTIWTDSTGVAPVEPFTPSPTVAPID